MLRQIVVEVSVFFEVQSEDVDVTEDLDVEFDVLLFLNIPLVWELLFFSIFSQ